MWEGNEERWMKREGKERRMKCRKERRKEG